jgi:hypothetical protein
LYNEMVIETCVENSYGAVLEALEANTAKRRPLVDPRPAIPSGIQEEIRLKNPALKSEANRLQRSVSHRLNE